MIFYVSIHLHRMPKNVLCRPRLLTRFGRREEEEEQEGVEGGGKSKEAGGGLEGGETKSKEGRRGGRVGVRCSLETPPTQHTHTHFIVPFLLLLYLHLFLPSCSSTIPFSCTSFSSSYHLPLDFCK